MIAAHCATEVCVCVCVSGWEGGVCYVHMWVDGVSGDLW